MSAGAGGPTLLQAMEDPELFGRWFSGLSWRAWRVFLGALFGLLSTESPDDAIALYRRHTGRQALPTTASREGWLVVGRRGGKSRIAALVAVYLACFRDWRRLGVLAPGERATVMIIAADRRQARVVMRYITGLLDAVPMLKAMVVRPTREALDLDNGLTIEVHSANFRLVRGYTIVAAICDELAFWRGDEGAANPDHEILAGLRPGLVTVPGALLLCISSPYARRGALWEAYRRHWAQDGDPVLVWQADTRSMNPTVDEQTVADAYVDDDTSAAAEWGAVFRRDLEDFLSPEALEAVVASARRELPPQRTEQYVAFVDPSGGSHDAMTLAIAHRERAKAGGEARAVLDVVLERRPPFNPSDVVREFTQVLRRYGVTRVRGDKYAGEWPRERFREHGIGYESATMSRSELYLELLPAIHGRRVELLDHPRLLAQLGGLERRTGRLGRDSVDHRPGGHDDVANAAAGALLSALARRASGARTIATLSPTIVGAAVHRQQF